MASLPISDKPPPTSGVPHDVLSQQNLTTSKFVLNTCSLKTAGAHLAEISPKRCQESKDDENKLGKLDKAQFVAVTLHRVH